MKLFPCLILLSACTQQQLVSEYYPVWGERVILDTGKNRNRHLQILLPPDQKVAKACILMVHGMNEHIGRYAEIAHYFAGDYVVAGIDLTAHGLSNPVFAKVQEKLASGASKLDVADAFLEQKQLTELQAMRIDLEHALTYLNRRCNKLNIDKKIPLFILTHSLGSLVSASWLLQTDNKILLDSLKGIVFTGPAFSVTEVPGWRGWFQNPFIQFTFHTHEHFLNPHNEALPLVLFNQLLSLVTVPLQDGLIKLLSMEGMRNIFSPTTPDWVIKYLSNWEQERIRHQADPYIIRRSMLSYVLTVEKEVIKFRANMSKFRLPYLLIYSEHDPITPAWGNVDFVATSLQNHSDNKVIMLAGENHHEHLFSTPSMRQKILENILSWLALRITNS